MCLMKSLDNIHVFNVINIMKIKSVCKTIFVLYMNTKKKLGVKMMVDKKSLSLRRILLFT